MNLDICILILNIQQSDILNQWKMNGLLKTYMDIYNVGW